MLKLHETKAVWGTPILLSLFFLLGTILSPFGGNGAFWGLGDMTASFFGSNACLYQIPWRLYGLLFFLASSVVGFFVIPCVFYLQGMAWASYVSRLLCSGASPVWILLHRGVVPILLLSALLFVASCAFDGSRSLLKLSVAHDADWDPFSFDGLLIAAIILLLALIFSLVFCE